MSSGVVITVFSIGAVLLVIALINYFRMCSRPDLKDESYGFTLNSWVLALAFSMLWYGASYDW